MKSAVRKLAEPVAGRCGDSIPVTAIDLSGFARGYCNQDFSERTGRIRKHFLKTLISIDTVIQVIPGSTTLEMLENYFDNVATCGRLVVTSWIEGMTPMRSIVS